MLNKKFIQIFLMMMTIILGCQKVKQEKIVSINQNKSDYKNLIKQVKLKGDTIAYQEICYVFFDSNFEEKTDSMMYYSKIMVDKYKYKSAYFDYLDALCLKNNVSNENGHFKIDIRNLKQSKKVDITSWLNKMLSEKIITKKQYDLVKK